MTDVWRLMGERLRHTGGESGRERHWCRLQRERQGRTVTVSAVWTSTTKTQSKLSYLALNRQYLNAM